MVCCDPAPVAVGHGSDAGAGTAVVHAAGGLADAGFPGLVGASRLSIEPVGTTVSQSLG